MVVSSLLLCSSLILCTRSMVASRELPQLGGRAQYHQQSKMTESHGESTQELTRAREEVLARRSSVSWWDRNLEGPQELRNSGAQELRSSEAE